MKFTDNILKNSQEPILPMLISNWIFGIGIIEYPLGHKRWLLSFFHSTSNLVMYLLAVYYCYPNAELLAQHMNINATIMKISCLFCAALTVSTVLLGWIRQKRLFLALEQITHADCSMEIIGVPRDYRNLVVPQIAKIFGSLSFIIFLATVNSLNLLPDNFKTIDKLLFMICINHPIVALFVVDAMFFNITSYVRKKIRGLNDALRNLIDCSRDDPQHVRIMQDYINKKNNKLISNELSCKEKIFVLKIAKKAHLGYVKSCQLIDSSFGLHVLLSLTVAVSTITLFLYHLYSLTTQKYFLKASFYEYLGTYVILFVYYSVKIYLLGRFCSSLSVEFIKIGDIISELYDEPSINKEAKGEIRDFEIQLIQNKIKFHVHGFVVLDFTLIQSFIGSITTYLMILIQLGMNKH